MNSIARDRPVAHRRIDVEDRRVPGVVPGADAIDAQADGLHERLALGRPCDAEPADGAGRGGVRRVHDPADGRIGQDREPHDPSLAARHPEAVLARVRRAEPLEVVLERFVQVRLGRGDVAGGLVAHAPDLLVLAWVRDRRERAELDARPPHPLSRLLGERQDARAVADEIQLPPPAAAVLAVAPAADHALAEWVVLDRLRAEDRRAGRAPFDLEPGEELVQARPRADLGEEVPAKRHATWAASVPAHAL